MILFLQNWFKKLPQDEPVFTFSTILTLIRIGLTPCIVVVLLKESFGLGLVLFSIAALTDFFDGFIARRYQQRTVLGSCLDPIADKILIVLSFTALLYSAAHKGLISPYIIWGLVFREFFLIVGSLYIQSLHTHVQVKPSFLGKMTMLLQVVVVIQMLIFSFFRWNGNCLSFFCMGAMLTTATLSFLQYIYHGYHFIVNNKN